MCTVKLAVIALMCPVKISSMRMCAVILFCDKIGICSILVVTVYRFCVIFNKVKFYTVHCPRSVLGIKL